VQHNTPDGFTWHRWCRWSWISRICSGIAATKSRASIHVTKSATRIFADRLVRISYVAVGHVDYLLVW
jgi:hypothetical protein